ncbi:prefoldin 6 [Osmia lignaria lignaria]|uniref:prefoldin 6 n=1 Tax=Osmia lignaria lignaria TaxID=1437193 RepID=UPI00402B9BDA
MTEEIQKNLKMEVDKYKQVEEEDDVFKLVGTALVKQDLKETKQNVAKRMEYISSELKQVKELITTLDKKQDTHRETLEKYQHMFQQAQLKASLSEPKA